MVVQVNFVS